MIDELAGWLAELRGKNYSWFLKRLSANDTQANGSHQSGLYIPKEFVFSIYPSLNRLDLHNPDLAVEAIIHSHVSAKTVRIVWYNGKPRECGTRNEARITQWGGESSPILDPENTGALVCFAFGHNDFGKPCCHMWVCRHAIEEDFIESCFGPVDPGTWLVAKGPNIPVEMEDSEKRANCYLEESAIPPSWLSKFPPSWEVVKTAVTLAPCHTLSPDLRLLRRRDCEFEIFKSIEDATVRPLIQNGFRTIDEFLSLAQSVLQRRKSRAGMSFELHTREILIEENFVENMDFSYQPQSEPNKRPDFIFPSEQAYADVNFPDNKLRMLAVKTTCKDRWRQIINEADKISTKHLFTLQQGVSEKQFNEMRAANVVLVVPQPNMRQFPKSIQPYLVSFESFLAEARLASL